ncbi:unnamed protein product, partial [Symbiodinium necroappetens]
MYVCLLIDKRSVMERTPPVEQEDRGEVANMEAAHLASGHDLPQGLAEDSMSWRWSRHRQCMEILVRQDCEQKCRKEHLEELKHKLREETQRRIEAEAKVTRLLDIIHSITRGTRVARLSVRSQVLKENAEKLVEEKNELKRRYDKLLTHSKRLDEEKTSLKQKCDDQFKQLQKLHLERLAEGLKEMLRLQGMEEEEWMQETATGSSRAE